MTQVRPNSPQGWVRRDGFPIGGRRLGTTPCRKHLTSPGGLSPKPRGPSLSSRANSNPFPFLRQSHLFQLKSAAAVLVLKFLNWLSTAFGIKTKVIMVTFRVLCVLAPGAALNSISTESLIKVKPLLSGPSGNQASLPQDSHLSS